MYPGQTRARKRAHAKQGFMDGAGIEALIRRGQASRIIQTTPSVNVWVSGCLKVVLFALNCLLNVRVFCFCLYCPAEDA